MKLTLLPGLARLWRDPNHLQLGIDPRRAVVMEFVDVRAAEILELLDGSRTQRQILTEAARRNVPPSTALAVLEVLRHTGLVVDTQSLSPAELPESARHQLAGEVVSLSRAQRPRSPADALRRRAFAQVTIDGVGRLQDAIAAALVDAGVGRVYSPATGRARGEKDGGLSGTRLVVAWSTNGRPPTLAALADARRGTARLTIDVREGTVVVGPLVPPSGSPCLNCLFLHRSDRDPAWPEVASQLALSPPGPCAATAVLAGAGLAASEVLAYVDGDVPQTLGTTIEIVAPDRVERRRWSPHPRCDCRHIRSNVPAQRHGLPEDRRQYAER